METHDLVESHTTVQIPFPLDTWIRLSNVILLGRTRANLGQGTSYPDIFRPGFPQFFYKNAR